MSTDWNVDIKSLPAHYHHYHWYRAPHKIMHGSYRKIIFLECVRMPMKILYLLSPCGLKSARKFHCILSLLNHQSSGHFVYSVQQTMSRMSSTAETRRLLRLSSITAKFWMLVSIKKSHISSISLLEILDMSIGLIHNR